MRTSKGMRWGKLIPMFVLSCGIAGMILSPNAQAKPDVPFVADALAKAQQASTAEGRWQVKAAVDFSSDGNGKMAAAGPVNAEQNELAGTLPMTVSGEAGDKNALALRVRRDGTVGIQWLIAGKPFLGRPMQYIDAIPTGNLLAAKIDFGGKKRLMKLTLTPEWVKNSPPPIRKPGPSQTEKKPIGKRYKITGYLIVTNSEDGFLDNTVEISGVLNYYQVADGGADKNALPEKTLLTIIKQDMNKGKTLPFDSNRYADYIYADPRTKCLVIRGSIYDDDAGLSDDPMLVGRTRAMPLEMLAKKGQQHFPGDNDSESCDVYYTVTEVGDLY